MLSTRESVDGSDPSDSTATAVDATGSWTFDDADELFLFVHGFSTDVAGARDQAYTAALALSAARSGDPPPVVGYGWASDVDWDEAKRTADANAAPLAEWLIDWADGDGDGRPVHVLGYSLGVRVVCETLRALAERGRSDAVASLSLLGGAIPHTSVRADGRYGPAIAAMTGPVGNFHSANDRVLGWVYRASDRTRAVGHSGISGGGNAGDTPAGYADVDVTELVADHYSYFDPEKGCMPRVIERIDERIQ